MAELTVPGMLVAVVVVIFYVGWRIELAFMNTTKALDRLTDSVEGVRAELAEPREWSEIL